MLDMVKNKKIPNPVDIHVGARIRMRRTLLGMSQEKLGEGLGITFQQVQKYEKGSNRVGASRLQAISTILSVPPSYFFEEAPDNPPSHNAEEDEILSFMRSPIGVELNRAFASIHDGEARRKLLGVVKLVAAQSNELHRETQH